MNDDFQAIIKLLLLLENTGTEVLVLLENRHSWRETLISKFVSFG